MASKIGGILARKEPRQIQGDELQAKENSLWFMFLRTLVTTLLLSITLIYQIKDSPLIRPEDLLPIYGLIGFTYFITILFASFIPKIQNHFYFVGIQILYDVFFVTGLIYLTSTHQASFTFLYLFIIAFSSLVYKRTGALYTAAFCSICFSTLLILDPIENNETHLMTLFFNNVAFFLVAILSGYLSEQFRNYKLRLSQEQESVKELEDLNKIIVNHISGGLVTTDLEHRIIFFNKAAEHITDLSFADVYQKEIFEIFPELKNQWLQKNLRPQQEITERPQFTFKNRKGENQIFGYSRSTLKNANHEKIGTILFFEDLTKLLEMEQHIRRSERLAAVGKLAAGIAHEIRNPLASVSGSIEMLSRELNVRQENKKLMHIILKETDRLNGLVSEFLDYVRPEQLKLQPLNIHTLIDETLTALAMDPQQSNAIKIAFISDDKLLEAPMNKEKMKQVLWNLLINAKQAMPKGGTLTIHTSLHHGEIKIDISDTGVGISQEDLKKIFDPFFTTKEKGTGLGLSMVHKIIEAHQGKILVHSKLKEGTTFSILLPTVAHAMHRKEARS